ncbi:hypothetical protein PIB30_007794 [Stylosanthes scabra]|uniref:Translocon Sec61/SecY plug domain-containing protein n=1 Tax=Stylosanthes scabra TaxID=79078 RepID=A0ABU6Z4D6_9FABA|nr:hypothetical protein [Stylosanthes scabra]
MAGLRFIASVVLCLLKPFLRYLPKVKSASRNLTFWRRLIYTAIYLFIFLGCSQIPLFRTHSTMDADPFRRMRGILASSPRTAMEFGISQIVIARYMYFSAGSRTTKNHHAAVRNAYQMILGIIITIVQAFACIKYGMYGQLGWVDSLCVMIQLSVGAITVIYLDQYFQKGYGIIRSGTSLFVATNICCSMRQKAFSITRINSERGDEFEGAVIALFHLLFTRTDKSGALYEAFFRKNLPNFSNLLATVFIFLLVVWFHGVCFLVPVRSTNIKERNALCPIKFFYTSNMPIILQSSFVSIIYLFSQFLHWNFGPNHFTYYVGNWKLCEHSGQFIPVSGVAYLVTTPSYAHIAADPFLALFFMLLNLLIMVGGCAFFSIKWPKFSGTTAKEVLEKIRKLQWTMDGLKNSEMESELKRYIVTAVGWGGICIGALTVLGDLFMGPFGTGAEILLAATILCQFHDEIFEEIEDH